MDKFNREDRTSDYVCHDCGVKYLTAEQLEGEGDVCTATLDNCGVCGKEVTVIHIRHYNWLHKIKC